MLLPWRTLRKARPSPFNLPSCKAIVKALLAVNIAQGNDQIAASKRLAAGLTAAGISLLLVWVILCVVRFRVLRRRPSRLITDVAAALLAAGATVLFSIAGSHSSNERFYPFFNAPYNTLKSSTTNETVEMTAYFTEMPNHFEKCIKRHQSKGINLTQEEFRKIKLALEVMSTAMPKMQPVIYVLAIICVVAAAIAFLTSVVSAILAGCVKAVPEEDTDRHWAAPPRVTRPPPGPSHQFFHRFLEPVTPPPEGVFGAREYGDCRICLEVLMDDIAKLSSCAHPFHKKCILQWLVQTDKPFCPLCKEPVRLVQR